MKKFFRCIMMMVAFAALAAGVSALVMLLWNWLMPTIFGLTAIAFWQALGLLVLAKLLFGHGMHERFHRHRERHNAFHDKWMKMSPDARREFIRSRHLFWEHKTCAGDSAASATSTESNH